jgi:hypothetical protein
MLPPLIQVPQPITKKQTALIRQNLSEIISIETVVQYLRVIVILISDTT